MNSPSGTMTSFFPSQEDRSGHLRSPLRTQEEMKIEGQFYADPPVPVPSLAIDPSHIPMSSPTRGASETKPIVSGGQVLSSLFGDEDDDDIDEDDNGISAGPSFAAEETVRSVQYVPEERPVVELRIHNVGCNYSLMSHINLQHLARNSYHVEYNRSKGCVQMQMRSPTCYAKVTSAGKVVIFATQGIIPDECYETRLGKYFKEEDLVDPAKDSKYFTLSPQFVEKKAYVCARILTRKIHKVLPNVSLGKFKVNNIFGSCSFPFGIKLEEMHNAYPPCSYEPELKPGMDWKMKKGQMVNGQETPVSGHLTMYHSGKVTFAGFASEKDLLDGFHFLYDQIVKFKGPMPEKSNRAKTLKRKQPHVAEPEDIFGMDLLNFGGDFYEDSESDEDDFV